MRVLPWLHPGARQAQFLDQPHRMGLTGKTGSVADHLCRSAMVSAPVQH